MSKQEKKNNSETEAAKARYKYIGPAGPVVVVSGTGFRFQPAKLRTDSDVERLLESRPELIKYFEVFGRDKGE